MSDPQESGNVNRHDEATVTTYALDSVTAVVIAAANPARLYFSVCLDEGTTDEAVAIRLYPASTDNIAKGEFLTRRMSGNDALFRPSWPMPLHIYTGEVSAITVSGTATVHVTEY